MNKVCRLDDERQRRWVLHCERMAEATHALADWCEDADMLATYLELAAKWMRMAAEGSPSGAKPEPGLH